MNGSTTRTTMGSADLLRHAKALRDVGDRLAATAELEKLCARDNAYQPGWIELSSVRIACGDYAGGLAAAHEVLRLDPNCLSGLINAGVAALELGDLSAARRHLEAAVAIDCFNPIAQCQLGRTLARLGETDAAINAYVGAIGEAHRDREVEGLIIERSVREFAVIAPPSPLEEPLQSLHDGVRCIAAGRPSLAAYRHLERARDSPCGFGMLAIRKAAEVLLGEIWRRRARMAPTPNDAERPCAPIIHLRP